MSVLVALTLASVAEAKTLTITRTQEVQAPPEIVWAYVGDYNTWKNWTAWNADMDPEATWSITGEPGTVGHTSEWTGPELGEGKMVVASVSPNQSLNYDLYFDGKDKNYPGGITLTPSATGTTVTWSYSSEMGGLAYALFAKKVDEMVGGDFAEGLANLAVLAAKDAEAAARAAKIAELEATATTKAEAAAAAKKSSADADGAAKSAAEAAATAKAAADAAKGKAKAPAAEAAAKALADSEAAAKKAAELKTAADAAQAEADTARAAADAAKAAQ